MIKFDNNFGKGRVKGAKKYQKQWNTCWIVRKSKIGGISGSETLKS